MCVLNLGRDVLVVEVAIGMGDRCAAVSLHGVIKFVVVVKFNPVAQLVDDDRIDLNRGAFHQVIGELSYHLMKRTPIQVDAVIVHELCHGVEFNHDNEFYYAMERYGGAAIAHADRHLYDQHVPTEI